MAEQGSELRRIDWSECFAFTQIFRTFRVAAQPGKLVLALAAIVLMVLWGVILDAIWMAKYQPVEGEVNTFWQISGIDAWRDSVKASYPSRLEEVYTSLGQSAPEGLADDLADDPDDAFDDAQEKVERKYADEIDKLDCRQKEDRADIAAKATEMNALYAEIESMRPQGVFASFCSFEMAVIRQMMDAARGLNFDGHIGEVINARAGGAGYEVAGTPDAIVAEMLEGLREAAAETGGGGPASAAMLAYPTVRTGPEGIGVLSCVVLMLRGVQWLIVEHWFFALIFLLDSLAIWALFGGAICRVAALNFARDERISLKASLSFAWRKFLGLFAAPLLPVALIVGIGVCLFVGGLVLAIPYVGDIIGGLTMGLSLLGGFVIALGVVGAIGGVWLMWPTIAVEGSDAFDAVSRSYSYVFSRPWRTILYALVAIVYGALCYLFARFFVLILLKATRFFVDLGASVFGTWRPGCGAVGAKKVDAIWPHPSFENLCPSPPPFGMVGLDAVGAVLIWLWTLLVAGLLCAFLVSFFFSGSTMIYYLLRREVDATDLDDVYIEEEDEEYLAVESAGRGASEADRSLSAGEETPAPEGSDETSPKEADDRPGDENT